MSGGAVGIPVIVALAVGIAFMVLFSSMLKPDVMLSDEELVSKYGKLYEVRHFLDRYPDARIDVAKYEYEDSAIVSYVVEKQVGQQTEFGSGVHTLTLTAKPSRQAKGRAFMRGRQLLYQQTFDVHRYD